MRTLTGRGTATRLALLAIVGAALIGCGSSTAMPAGSSGGDTGYESAPSAAASAAPSAAPAAPGDGSGTGGDNGGAVPDPALKIVYTGSLQMVVGNVPDALARAKMAVAAAGGYIGASQESNDGDRPSATITYRIPAAKWDETITAIRGVGTKVVHEETQATEVGGQLVDLEARLANLRAAEASLQEIAKATAKVSDLLEVQNQLYQVRGQIEEIDGQRAHLADQVAYGTLVTTFGVEVEQVKTAAKGWDPSSDVDGATAAMLSLGQHLVSGAIWFVIVWVPMLAVLGVLGFIAWKVIRRLGQRFAVTPSEPPSGWGGGPTPPPPAPPQG